MRETPTNITAGNREDNWETTTEVTSGKKSTRTASTKRETTEVDCMNSIGGKTNPCDHQRQRKHHGGDRKMERGGWTGRNLKKGYQTRIEWKKEKLYIYMYLWKKYIYGRKFEERRIWREGCEQRWVAEERAEEDEDKESKEVGWGGMKGQNKPACTSKATRGTG